MNLQGKVNQLMAIGGIAAKLGGDEIKHWKADAPNREARRLGYANEEHQAALHEKLTTEQAEQLGNMNIPKGQKEADIVRGMINENERVAADNRRMQLAKKRAADAIAAMNQQKQDYAE